MCRESHTWVRWEEEGEEEEDEEEEDEEEEEEEDEQTEGKFLQTIVQVKKLTSHNKIWTTWWNTTQ